jgi:endonuclease VIII
VPEGDTIHRSANTMRPVLVGQRVLRLELPRHPSGVRPAAGADIGEVSARGKHLLIGFSGGLVLHTHMGMTGSWHLYRPGERWRRPPSTARVVIETTPAVAVCFAAPVVELLDAQAVARHPVLSSRGPDLVAGAADDVIETALERLRMFLDPGTGIGVALLDQRVACGVGNVYKSEVCHACGVNPFTPVGTISDDLVRELYRTASRMLVANLTTRLRTTVATRPVGGGGLAVYRRARRPCRRCSTPIEVAGATRRPTPAVPVVPVVGRRSPATDVPRSEERVTYWCPRCQP